MIIGCPKEIKDKEFRVGLVPAGVKALVEAGHRVYIEEGAGDGCGISRHEYHDAGAVLLRSADELWARSEMVIKVKEPLPAEYGRLREELILFTYLHLAPLPELTRVLLEKKVTAIAYETVREADGSLPLLTPMSEVAGRMSVQIGARYLEKTFGGRGVLLGGVPGVPPAQVVILGGGVVGSNAARMAVGTNANVTILDINVARLRQLDDIFGGRVATLAANAVTLVDSVKKADLLIGAVLVPGASAPKLVSRPMLRMMKPGAVAVDVAIDQGGCLESSRPTSHSDPIYIEEEVLHYCVPNIPAAVSRTSTFALTNVTLPHALKIANLGIARAVDQYNSIREGVNTCRGEVTYPAVAHAHNLPYTPVLKLLS